MTEIYLSITISKATNDIYGEVTKLTKLYLVHDVILRNQRIILFDGISIIDLCILYDVGRSDALVTERSNVTTYQLSKNKSSGKDDHIKVYGIFFRKLRMIDEKK